METHPFPAAASEPMPPACPRGSTARQNEALPGQPLPTWAQSLEARLLLSLIAEERPDFVSIKPTAWSSWVAPHYQGKNASALRRIYREEYSRQIQLCAEGKPRDAVIDEMRVSADALIERVLEGGL